MKAALFLEMLSDLLLMVKSRIGHIACATHKKEMTEVKCDEPVFQIAFKINKVSVYDRER